MATQTLEIDYVPGQTLTAKLFAIGSDTVVQTASSVTEAANRSGRYRAVFTDAPAANYMMRLFNGGVGASSDNYTLLLATATYQPWSEAEPSGGGGGGSNVGPGSTPETITITVNGLPADGVAVWISTDAAGINVIAGTIPTDAFGEVEFMLDPGTYYCWKQRAGDNFTNPEAFTVV